MVRMFPVSLGRQKGKLFHRYPCPGTLPQPDCCVGKLQHRTLRADLHWLQTSSLPLQGHVSLKSMAAWQCYMLHIYHEKFSTKQKILREQIFSRSIPGKVTANKAASLRMFWKQAMYEPPSQQEPAWGEVLLCASPALRVLGTWPYSTLPAVTYNKY